MQVLSVVSTPNPDALKFITEDRLVRAGAKSFDEPRQAEADPLARALFASGPVASVFYMDRFVTVTKFPTASWEALQPKVVAAIESNAKPAQEPASDAAGAAGGSEDALGRIRAVIEENVLPALASDGGGLEIVDFQDNVLTVHYQGACGSCPSSSAGTMYAIQNLLQRLVDEKIQVVSA